MNRLVSFQFGKKLGIGRKRVQEFNLKYFIIIGVNCQNSENHNNAKNLLNPAGVLVKKTSFGKNRAADVGEKKRNANAGYISQ